MDSTSRLRQLLVKRSVSLGDFTLASGARSSYYIDARRTTMSGEGQLLTGRVCLAAILAARWTPTHVGGLTLGADPISYAIANEAFRSGVPMDAFTVRKAPKGHGTASQVEGGLPTDARVVVIEDSMTSGGSALKAADVLVDYGVEIVGMLTLVDREEGGRERVEAAGYELISVYPASDLVSLAKA